MYVHDGKILGGNSAFAHIGTYEKTDDGIDGSKSKPSVTIPIRTTARWRALKRR